jgi:hypothetical protein
VWHTDHDEVMGKANVSIVHNGAKRTMLKFALNRAPAEEDGDDSEDGAVTFMGPYVARGPTTLLAMELGNLIVTKLVVPTPARQGHQAC